VWSLASKNVLNKKIALEAREIINGSKTLILSTVDSTGFPHASYAPFVHLNNRFYIYTSGLARHTENLLRSNIASVLFIEGECSINIFHRRRFTLSCRVKNIGRRSGEFAQFMNIFKEAYGTMAETLESLSDFQLFRITPSEGLYVKGFGEAYKTRGSQLKCFKHVSAAELRSSVK